MALWLIHADRGPVYGVGPADAAARYAAFFETLPTLVAEVIPGWSDPDPDDLVHLHDHSLDLLDEVGEVIEPDSPEEAAAFERFLNADPQPRPRTTGLFWMDDEEIYL